MSQNTYIGQFEAEISVVCPACGGEAVVRKENAALFAPRTCACAHCGFARKWESHGPRSCLYCHGAFAQKREANGLTYCWDGGPMADPAFGFPLFFQTDCRGHNLWAFNRDHIAFLKRWIEADLREKCERDHAFHGALEATLPKWMLSRKNRDAVLKALRNLERKT